jgi:hypothetical protein
LGGSHPPALRTVWGIHFDLSNITQGAHHAFVTLTDSKSAKMRAWARLPVAASGARRVRVKDHQALVGNVQWWSTCSPALRSLLPMLYAMSAHQGSLFLEPPSEREWEEYDDAKALLRLLIDMGTEQPDLFKASLVDALEFYDVTRLPAGLHVPVRYIGSDANGLETGGVMSAVDYTAGTWTVARALEYAPDLIRLCSQTGTETPDDDLIILVTELLAVIALAAQHAPAWTGYHVAAMIDNEGARIALTTRRSRNRYVRYLLLVLSRLEFQYKFKVVAFYVNTKTNWFLDYIGRDLDLDAPDALDTLQREVMRESTVCAEQHEREMMKRALALSRDESESASTRAAAAIEERELGDAMARSLLAVTEGEQMLAVVVNSQLPTLTAMFTSYPVGLLRHALERTQRVGVGGVPSVDADLAVSWLFESGAEYLQTHLELYRG